jgi:long-chain acyl-CoA synthetase
MGGVVVCCNPLYVLREIEHLAKDSGLETFVVMSSLYDKIKGIRAQTAIKNVVAHREGSSKKTQGRRGATGAKGALILP